MASIDVTVMGGGIFGLSVAWECARRGARVRLVEARAIGAGSSGGLVGALAPHVPEAWNPKKAFQRDALLAAEGFWRTVARVSGCDPLFARTGRVQPLADESEVERARDRALQARDLWQGRAEWRVCPAESLPALGLDSATGLVVFDTLSARLHPRAACDALAAGLAALGADIVVGKDDPGPVPGRVVWATGHDGLAALGADLGAEVGTGVKGQALSLRHDAAGLPQVFAGGLHIVPHGDGTVAVGSTTERDFDSPDTVDAGLDTVEAQARRLCPALAAAPRQAAWAGVRPRSRSRAPVLGLWPGRPGHFVANGGFKIGFGIAPAVASVMADLVLDGHDAIPDGFRVADNLPVARR